MAETLQEYLVGLGFAVDEKGLKSAVGSIGQLKNSTGVLARTMKSSFGIAATAVASAVLAVNKGVISMIDTVARADLETERFSRRMWTSERSARAFTSALDAMGKSYEDIFYMTPEEYGNFQDLRSYGAGLEAPAALKDSLRDVRALQNEFNKLKISLSYGFRWVSYYILSYLKEPLQDANMTMQDLNSYIAQNLPKIAKSVADFLMVFIRLGQAAFNALKMIKDLFMWINDRLPRAMLTAGAAVAGFVGLFSLGPIGAFIGAITMLLLLLDDFMVWEKGGKSVFGEMWQKFAGFKAQIDDFNFDKLDASTQELWDNIKGLAGDIANLFGMAIDFANDFGLFEKFFNFVNREIEKLAAAIGIVGDGLGFIFNLLDGMSLEDSFNQLVDSAGSKIGDAFGAGIPGLNNNAFSKDLSRFNGSVLPAYERGSRAVTNNNSQNNNIVINESVTPRATAKEVNQQLMINARNLYNPGVN